jgi:hypothetical protein
MTPILVAIASLFTASPAHAAVAPLDLSVPKESVYERYATSQGNSCLVLDAGRPLGEQDTVGLKKLINDIDVNAGPGVQPEAEPAGSLLYVYSLVPELKNNTVVFRGLLSNGRGASVRVTSRSPASLGDVVSRDLGFSGNVSLVFSHDCE